MAIRKSKTQLTRRIQSPRLSNLSALKSALAKISTRTRVLPRLKAAELELMSKPETRAGSGKGAVPRTFTVKEKLQFLRPAISASTQPNWVRALAEKKVNNRAAIKATLERVDRFPTKPNLTVAQHVLNDIGARKGGGAQLRKLITQEIVTQLIKKGG